MMAKGLSAKLEYKASWTRERTKQRYAPSQEHALGKQTQNGAHQRGKRAGAIYGCRHCFQKVEVPGENGERARELYSSGVAMAPVLQT